MLSDDMEFERLLKLATTVQRSQVTAVDELNVRLRHRPAREEIALRAYQIYLRRGAVHRFDLEDLLQAERKVTSARTSHGPHTRRFCRFDPGDRIFKNYRPIRVHSKPP